MWIFYTLVVLSVLSLLMYAAMHQQISKIMAVQQRAFHLRSNVQIYSRSTKRLRYLYLIVTLVLIGYSILVYFSIFS